MKTFGIHRYLSYDVAVEALALSFCIGAINVSLSDLFHFQLSSLHTAASMYLPLLLSLGILLALNYQMGAPLLDARGLILLGFLCGFWLINYFSEVGRMPSASLSEYDGKRLWLFVQGVLLSSLIGLHVPRDTGRFTRCFLTSFGILSTMSSLLYLLTYRSAGTFVRLLGERALGVGLVACFGAASCLALLFLHIVGSRRLSGRLRVALVGAISIHAVAIAMSATRGAALSAMASMILFVWMTRRSKAVLPILAFLILSFIGVIVFAKTYMPEATMRRLTMRQHGADLRYELTITMLDLIIERPSGRVFGYGNTRLSMEYSHNAVLQYIGEAGLLQTAPVMLLLLYGAVRNLIRHRADVYVQALGLFGLPILIESCSAGSAYESRFWFLVFFISCLRGKCVSAVPE